MPDSTAPEARASLLTGNGRGAISVARVWGRDAIHVADAVFRPDRGDGLKATQVGRLRLGRVGQGIGDEVVTVVLARGPLAEVEFQGHAGPAATRLVLEALRTQGATIVGPETWVENSAGRHYSLQASNDLPMAPTIPAAEILLDQADGALDREFDEIRTIGRQDRAAASDRIDRLVRRSRVGTRLVSGWSVALAGRPNVGKSRLMNALAGYERAIVDPTPGTTRDVVTVRVAFGGWPAEVSDTAGLRETDDILEVEGVARSRSAHQAADVVLLVLDLSEPLTPDDQTLIENYPNALRVANKSDLPPAWNPVLIDAIAISAATGSGIDGLVHAVARGMVPEPIPPGVAVPFRQDHLKDLNELRDEIGAHIL